MRVLEKVNGAAAKYFALWVVLFSVVGFFVAPLAGLTEYVALLLGVVMFGMGLTLTGRFFRRPGDVAVGVAAQFTVMPLVAFGLAYSLGLPPELAFGVILLGCCPGGTASNVIAYLSRGDVPLSVSMTAVSTVLVPLLTPALMLLLAQRWLSVDAAGFFLSIVQIVLVPVALGVLVNTFFGGAVRRVSPVLPLVSVVGLMVIVTAIVAANRENLLSVGPLVLAVVVVHNLCGYLLGYGIGRALGVGPSGRRAIVVEVDMQNSGLATTVFSGGVAALPGAIFSVWNNVSGPLLATYWRRRSVGGAPAGAAPKPTEVST